MSRQLLNPLVLFWCCPCWRCRAFPLTFKVCGTANTKASKQGAESNIKEEKRGAAAEADVGGNFIPVLKPEDLPKGVSHLVLLAWQSNVPS